MLEKIIAFSIKNKLIILLATAALIVWGIWSATKLPIDAVPDITSNQVQIITTCPTLAGQEVEQLVSYPIEQGMANLPDLEELRSVSRFGLSVITLVFNDKTDIYFARQLINEKLKEVEKKIPANIGTPELAPVSTGLGEVYQYLLRAKKGSEKKYTAMDLRTLQDWIVARQLYGTPGVAEVNSFGGALKQYEVSINPNKLQAMNVSIAEIFSALEKNNENTGGAYIDKKPNAYFIRSLGLIHSFEDIKNIAVKNNPNGIPILIKDVAQVGLGKATPYGAMTYEGNEEVVGGIVMMLKGANGAEVVNRIKEKMQQIKTSLPKDVVIEPFLDRTDLIKRAISTVEKNLIEGALIVLFVLVLFLGSIRSGLIVASVIPLSMLFALGLMNVFQVSANLMSLGAIDFGLLVDGTIIIVEATMHHLGLRKTSFILSQKEIDAEVLQSASKIRKSAAFGEIIILLVYIPILTLVGIEGKMFRPMAQTVGFAIVGALILSLTYVPIACALFLQKKPSIKKNKSEAFILFLQKTYTPLLEKAIQLKKEVLAATFLLLITAVLIFSKIGGEFMPVLQEGDFAFHCILPQGTSISQSVETSMQAMRLIKEFDEVKMVVGKTGSAEIPTDPMPPEATDMIIVLKPVDEWKRKISYNELADEILQKISVIPGVFFEKSQPIQMRFNELMTGVKQDVAIKIFGENLDTLYAYAKKTHHTIKNIQGVSEANIERVEGLPQIVIKYHRNQIANYGLNIEYINNLVRTAFAGKKAGVVFENERRFDLVLRLDSNYRNSIEHVNQLYVSLADGTQIPLSQLAEISTEIGPAQISREQGKRRIVIGLNVKGNDVTNVVQAIQEKLNQSVTLPEGYYYTYGGTFKNMQEANKRLSVALPIALILIFILLYFTFHSAGQAFLVFTAVPMSAIGGIFALSLRSMSFSISAGIGFIALFGVAVLNGIVLISTFNQLEKEGMADAVERIKEGTKIRLRPVLMTATVASLGFLPMALSSGAGAEVQKPLATVVIGGLLSATCLTLFVLPLLYLLFSKKEKIKTPASSLVILAFFLFAVNTSHAQTKSISVEEAIKTAQQNNLRIKAQDLNVQAAKVIKKTAFELPKTAFNTQLGQYNSINQDKGFSIIQNIPFPSYFSEKALLYKEEIKKSDLEKRVVENEIRSQVRYLFYQLQYLQQVKKTLQSLDSLYSNLEKAAGLRYQLGETNLLEKATADAKRGQFSILWQKNETDIFNFYASLKNMMNTKDDFDLDTNYSPVFVTDSLALSLAENNVSLKVLQQQAFLIGQAKRVETASALPDFTIGYFNQSLIGTQIINGSDIYFDGSKRFQGLNVGVNIPVSFFSNIAKVKSLDYKKQSAIKEIENEKNTLQTQIQNAYKQYKQALSQYQYYKTHGLTYAKTIMQTASLSLKTGNIHYIEYLQALQTATDIQMAYLQSINQINQSTVQINFLINN
ncbi:MAG: CusA/CzcA family heavy metal efflux RND transporter [Bacteroidetes bacterium]|nr:CusA/CzcA family heavy metal efflux RND transporter [Bacteroidota bacterium]